MAGAFDEIAVLIPGRLFMSSAPGGPHGPAEAELAAHDINVVINMWGGGETVLEMDRITLIWPIFDNVESGTLLPDTKSLNALVDFIVALLAAGRRVLIHCQQGLNRSGLVAALVLRKVAHMSPDAAVNHIRRQRHPDALFNAHFVGLISQS